MPKKYLFIVLALSTLHSAAQNTFGFKKNDNGITMTSNELVKTIIFFDDNTVR